MNGETLTELRAEYWLVKGRQFVRRPCRPNPTPPLFATEFITSLEFDASDKHDDSNTPFLTKVLRFSAGLDPISIEELKLEYGTKKYVVGGAFDIVIGCKSNGRKPRVTLHNNYE